MRNSSPACCFALIATSHISAAPLRVLGLDDMSCAAWTVKIDPELREPYIQWVRGFLSGHNYANQSRQVAEVSSGTVEKFVDRYCRENPRATVADAAMRMSDRYSGRNSPITR
jgi:hypothetical protein